MKPVILTALPNEPGFIGSEDFPNWQIWYRCEPLPGAVAELIDTDWSYGQYHTAIARMQDGTYSVFLSRNFGKSWESVLNTPVQLYAIIQIIPGLMILTAADGWRESPDSGKTWTFISGQAPGCREVINPYGDVLLAHDGDRIWKSTDRGRNWRIVIEKTRIYLNVTHGGTQTLVWSGDSYPALAGMGDQIVAAFGPYFIVSDDCAENWNQPYWYYYASREEFQPLSSKRILQIVLTKNVGPNDNWFMIRFYNQDRGTVRAYWCNQPYHHQYWAAKFDQPFQGYYAGKITAYDVLRVGSDTKDTLVFCQIPNPKYSPNGGADWIDLQPQQWKIYPADPAQSGFEVGGPFLSESTTRYTWSGWPCHNAGVYNPVYGHMERALSYDMDVLFKATRQKTWQEDVLLQKTFEAAWDMDVLNKKALTHSIPFKLLLQKTFAATWNMSPRQRATFNKTWDMGLRIVFQRHKTWTMNALIQETFAAQWWMRAALKGALNKTFQMDVILLPDTTDKEMERIKVHSFQEWDLRPQGWPKKVMNYEKKNWEDEEID